MGEQRAEGPRERIERATERMGERRDAAVERMGERRDAAVERMGERRDGAVEAMATARGNAADAVATAKENTAEAVASAKASAAEAIAKIKPKLRGVSHEWAFFLSLGLGAALIVAAEGAKATVAVAIYTVSLSALFGVSALYHRVTWRPEVRVWMRRLDHTMIFLLIAGTITPFALLVLEGGFAKALLIGVWGAALGGIVVELIWVDAPKWLAAIVYVAVGLIGAVAYPEIVSKAGIGAGHPDRRRRRALHHRGRDLRRRAPRPQPGRVRLPRDLPRPGHRRGGRPLRRHRVLRSARGVSDAPGRIVGVGGVFRRAKEPDALRAFYVEQLGLPLHGETGMLTDEGGITVVGFFDADTEYFGPAGQEAMFNFRVDDLDALLAKLRAAGADVDEEKGVEEMEGIGRFAWITDPEGNRVELWEPESP